jgi:hypothetical protein
MILLPMAQGKSFKESLKTLEADIQHANTLASELPRDYDGACLQMRLSYVPAAHFLLFLVQWTDCSLAGALGLLHILIYKVYMDGTTTMSTYERKASFHEFYGMFVNGGSASLEISVQSAMLDAPYSLCLKLLIWLVCEISDLKFFPGPWQLCRNWTWRC